MGKHTIDTLPEDFEKFKRSANNRFTKINKILQDMQPKLQDMHDFVIDSRGFERGQASYKKDGSVNLDPRLIDVIKWALLIAVLALGGAKWL